MLDEILRSLGVKYSDDFDPGCSVDIQSTRIIVSAQEMTLHFGAFKEPIFILAGDVDQAELGDKVLACLACFSVSKENQKYADNQKFYLKRIGEKSWKGFAKKTIHVHVALDRKKSLVTLWPSLADKTGNFPYTDSYPCAHEPHAIAEKLMEIRQKYLNTLPQG